MCPPSSHLNTVVKIGNFSEMLYRCILGNWTSGFMNILEAGHRTALYFFYSLSRSPVICHIFLVRAVHLSIFYRLQGRRGGLNPIPLLNGEDTGIGSVEPGFYIIFFY